MKMFLTGSDLTPIAENIDKIIHGLTRWEPRTREIGASASPKLRFQGKDYEEALINMNHMFLRNMWGDGLPLLPATEERVKRLLLGTDLSPDVPVGRVLPGGHTATVESIAVCLAMAGGRAEYMPVLIAAIQVITDPQWKHQFMNATTCSVFPTVIVNGPVCGQIRLNSGYGLLGPRPDYPAGASIGRAIRLILQDMGGAVAGIGTMAQYGGMRYTNAVFAEDENGLPQGWKPLSVDRGFPKGTNTVTVLTTASATNVTLSEAEATTAEEVAKQFLYRIAAFMGTPSPNAFRQPRGPNYSSGVLLIGRGWAEELAKLGWSKEKVKSFLWENSKLPWSEAERTGLTKLIADSKLTRNEPLPLTNASGDLMVVVAGGAQSGHAYWMQAGPGYAEGSQEIRLPARRQWQELMEQAEKDLGPVPD
ncbi:MAG: hypothetical protein HYX90_09600 [Chloroflexi bacterium]|nr:hypothetical protein [Chloroflexota bacterium]